MNLLALENAAYRRLQVAEAQTGDFKTRIDGFLNRWHRQVLSQSMFRSFRKTQVTEATVVDQWRYGVKLMEIFHITERSNERRLIKQTEVWWRQRFPDPSSHTGDPRWWIPLGQTRIKIRPANASELFAISSSASDTNTLSAEVIRAGGERRLVSVTMTGTTGVSLDTAITDVVDILDVYVSAVAVGLITLREDSGVGTVLSEIDIGESFPRYTQIALARTPSSVQTLFIDGTIRMSDLVNALDEPLIPEDFHDILVDGAVYDEWLNKGRIKEAQWLRDEIAKRVQEMRSWVYMNVVQPEPDPDSSQMMDPELGLTLPLT